MKLREVLSVVPKFVRTFAPSLVALAILIGGIAGFFVGRADHRIHAHAASSAAMEPIVGLGVGLFAGVLAAGWVLGLGYVYGDARRRSMPAIPWTLVAAMVPNLLGFLLYFVLRKPIGSPCAQCGQVIVAGQRYCPWCGRQGPSIAGEPLGI